MAEYIEREALLAWFGDYKANDPNEYLSPQHIIDDIAEIPAADVAPVVHGEWVVCGDGEDVPWMCSHCGKTTAHKYKTMYGKYCPNCGARMDGE